MQPISHFTVVSSASCSMACWRFCRRRTSRAATAALRCARHTGTNHRRTVQMSGCACPPCAAAAAAHAAPVHRRLWVAARTAGGGSRNRTEMRAEGAAWVNWAGGAAFATVCDALLLGKRLGPPLGIMCGMNAALQLGRPPSCCAPRTVPRPPSLRCPAEACWNWPAFIQPRSASWYSAMTDVPLGDVHTTTPHRATVAWSSLERQAAGRRGPSRPLRPLS